VSEISKKQLRETIGAPSVGVINEILKEAGIEATGDMLPAKVGEFVRAVHDLMRTQNKSIKLAVEEVAASYGKKDKDVYQKGYAQALAGKLQHDAKEFHVQYYSYLPKAINSAVVFNDPEVSAARENAFASIIASISTCTEGIAGASLIGEAENFTGYLEQELGALGIISPSLPQSEMPKLLGTSSSTSEAAPSAS
jgi:hypothetical protein